MMVCWLQRNFVNQGAIVMSTYKLRFALHLRSLFAAALVLVALPAAGGTVGFEFNTDGVLPSAQGAFHGTSGPSEASTYSVSGGLLHQGSFSSANPNDSIGYRGEVAYDPALPATWEWRVRILDPIDVVTDGIGLQSNIDVGGRIMTFVMRTNALGISGANPQALFFDVGTGFHHYRIEFNPGASHFDFFFDGTLLHSDDVAGTSGAHPLALIYWLGGQDSASQWDFVRFANTAAAPAPGTTALLALAVLAMGLARRAPALRRIGYSRVRA